tara:strand:+ start:369 stop:752 length:384 start_codon:yes stop_codon:yes gene_type:complete
LINIEEMIKSIPKIVSLWVKTVSERNPKKQTQLYSKSAVLLATFQTLFLGREGVMEYMIGFLNKEGIECQIIDNYTQKDDSGKFQISSGLYEFYYLESGIKKTVKARYTFVVKNNLIISHHSSVQPN